MIINFNKTVNLQRRYTWTFASLANSRIALVSQQKINFMLILADVIQNILIKSFTALMRT